MTEQVEKQPERKRNIYHIALLSIVLVIPGSMPLAFGWLTFLFPLLTFVHIQKLGWNHSRKHFTPAVVAAIIIGLILQRFEATLFAVMLPPVGFILADSAKQDEEPWKAGMKGWLFLCLIFIIFMGVHSIGSSSSFFATVTAGLHSAIDESLNEYSNYKEISAESFRLIEQTMLQVKATAPLFLPAIFGSGLLLITWSTIALGNILTPLLGRVQPWPDYRYWKLPDTLIWAIIIAAVAATLPNRAVQLTGWNCLMLLAILYFFQGLAIAAFYLDKWKLPKFFRAVMYLMLILQSFGTILLTIIGIADVWFDIRKLSASSKI